MVDSTLALEGSTEKEPCRRRHTVTLLPRTSPAHDCHLSIGNLIAVVEQQATTAPERREIRVR